MSVSRFLFMVLKDRTMLNYWKENILLVILLKILIGNGFVMEDHLGESIKCNNERVQIIVPYLSTDKGDFLAYFPSVTELDDISPSYYPEVINAIIPDVNRSLHLSLWKHKIHTNLRQRQWNYKNMTYMMTYDDDCFYQGFADHDDSSFVAVSTCDGLRGYIQTNRDRITIEPSVKSRDRDGQLEHVVRICNKPKEYKNMHKKHVRRKKRQAPSQKKYLEVLIAADTSVVQFVGEDKVETYLLSLMNIVNRVYKHETLSADIEVITVKTLLIDQQTEKTIVVKNDARRTVDYFCRWATVQAYNNQYYGGGNKFDIAVYLTRTGLGPAGYAPITGLCNPGRSCAVVKDEGFTSAFIIAHEIAHVFGLFHNGHGNNCNGRTYQTSIMAAMVQATLQQYWWTECSNKRMNQVLPTLTCLNNNPSLSVSEDNTPLGQWFTINEQCRFEFGGNHELCRNFYGNICPMLWCAERRRPNLCKTKRGPPLNGTKCGNEKWCVEGRCEYYGQNKAVDGQWGDWSAWSNCSADCGIGIKQRTRDCNDPSPAFGGKMCTGISSESNTCKSSECTVYTDHRKLQCAVLDALPVRRGYHRWFPYQVSNSKKACFLTCISNKTKEIATFDDMPVEDGTPCSYDEPNNICINAQCIKVGCDGIKGSKIKDDNCGKCGGNGSTCKEIKGLFKQRLTYTGKGLEYAEAITLPSGSRHIEIKETATSPHILALYDPGYGQYILNGNNHQGRSKNFVAKGAWFVYKNHYGYETLKSKGPLHRKLILMVHPRNKHSVASLRFKYTVAKDDFTYEKTLYEYKYDGWTECSVTCGTGTQHLIYNCFNKQTGKKENDTRCQFMEKPVYNLVSCERIECNAEVFRWVMSLEWETCNATCGNDGYQLQKYTCEQELRDGISEKVSFDLCTQLSRPLYYRPCNRKPCSKNRYVATDQWSSCSESCGTSGIKTKIYKCVDQYYNHLNDSECGSIFKPETAIPCNRKKCIREWYRLESTNRWSECSTTCGWDGYATRIYECKKINSNDEVEVVNLTMCDSYQGDKEMRACNQVPCNKGFYDWIRLSDWSECSNECGNTGIQYQEYGCFEVSNELDVHPVNVSFCSDDIQSNVTRPCNRIPCYDFKWMVSGWGPCSATCGVNGTQTELSTCEKHYTNGSFESVDDYFCSNISRNNITQECNRHPCFTYQWVMYPNWTECTTTCGNDGVQFQMYRCYKMFENESLIPANNNTDCKDIDPPNISRECNIIDCVTYQWSAAFDWGPCSQTCGNKGIQKKFKVCEKVFEDGTILPVSSSYCAHISNVTETKSCNRVPCEKNYTFKLQYTNLSACSASCGENGVQKYNIQCTQTFDNGVNKIAQLTDCRGKTLTLPQRDIPCNRKACPPHYKWKYSAWSQCSATCGIGKQTRQVFCADNIKSVRMELCYGQAPSKTQVCLQTPCPSGTPCKDRIKICKRSASKRKCSYRGYRKMCCAACRKFLRR